MVSGSSQHGHSPPMPRRVMKVWQSSHCWVPSARVLQAGHS